MLEESPEGHFTHYILPFAHTEENNIQFYRWALIG